MTDYALDHICHEKGCANLVLNPKLHVFDDCFAGNIRFGDIDGAVERNGWILWMEWKRGAILETFEKQHSAQVRQAREFTCNSPKQTFVFVLGDCKEMKIDAFRVMHHGGWRGDWRTGGIDGFREFLKTWFSYADSKRGAA